MIRSVQRRHVVRWLWAMLIAVATAAPAHAQSQYCTYSPDARSHRFGFPQWIGVPAGAPDGTVLASTTLSYGYSCPPTVSASGWSFIYRTFFTLRRKYRAICTMPTVIWGSGFESPT
ncbi:hypothetical protein [Burkholderia multivorans]|uniref:hypothetical protein n=1 Tax=Burkholderia multivorans TaxID=87883 RepID=UPI00027825D0|nr:hypothetical protein [Burkholderia multivorans]EJO60765.1 hypothetical protein BURMUCF2_3224 [Burkholderia multivorans CF2]